MTIRKFLLLSTALVLSFPVIAGEAEIRQAIEAKLGGTKVDEIQATPIPGIFEVRFHARDGVQIIYSDEIGRASCRERV